MPSFAVGKGVAIGSTVGVRRTDQDVIGRNATDLSANAISQCRWKPEEIESHNGHRDVTVSKDNGTGGHVPLFLAGWIRDAHPAGNGQKRVWRDHAHRGADLKLAASGGWLPMRMPRA